jgi:hypothetical protein
MRYQFLRASSLPIVITLTVIGLWQGTTLAEEVATTPEIVATPSPKEAEAGNDFGVQVAGDNAKAPELKLSNQEANNKNRKNNENLFVLFLQVLVSAK